jgi:PPP family 3-phenylpropionic acid transporter
METVPYWRVSGFYFFFFASLGALVPYLGLYLQSLGFDATVIGELMAAILITRVIAPNVWGWLADHNGRHMNIVRITSLFTVICFAGIFISNSYVWLLIVMVGFSFFWNGSLAPFEANTLAHLAEHSHRYSHLRLWGSIGFIVAVLLGGWLFKEINVSLFPTLVTSLLILTWLSTLLVPQEASKQVSISSHSFSKIVKHPSVIALFIVCFIMQASHGPYYTFYTIYLKDYGYSSEFIGQLWAFSIIPEIIIFLIMHHFLTRYSLKYLLILSLALASLRWILIGYYVEYLTILLFAQMLHAASFAMYHSVAMQMIRKIFVDAYQGRAQALYSSISFGAGGALGSLISGYTWEQLGAEITYLWAAIICIIAIGISYLWIEFNHKNHKL